MKKLFVIAILTASLAACGKKNASTTPGNTGGSAMEQTTNPTGGAGYGGNAYGAPANPCAGPGAGADPCAGGE